MKFFFLIFILSTVDLIAFGQLNERGKADSLFRSLATTKPGVERIRILNELAKFYIFKPGENQIDFDSASAYIIEARHLNESTKSPALSGELLLTESYMLKEKGKKNEARPKLEEAIKMMESSDDKYYLGKAFFELSGYYDYRDEEQYRKRISMVQKSINAFRQSKAIQEEAEALQMLGDLYNLYAEYDKAIVALEHALAAYDSVGHKQLQGVYTLLGDIYLAKNDYKQATYYHLLAMKTAQICKDSTMQLCQIYSNVAALYGETARDEIALKYHKEALKIAIRYDDRSAIAFTLYNISKDFIYLDQPKAALDFLATMPQKFLEPVDVFEKTSIAMAYMNAYLGLRQFPKTQFYCDSLLKMIGDMTIPSGYQHIIYRLAASHYLGMRQFQKVRYYLVKNASIDDNLGAKEIAADERIWYKLDSAQGNYASAFHHLNKYKAISDSLFNETKAHQLQQLDVEYETAKKEDSLLQKTRDISLLQQKNDLQQANLKQTNLIKNITIAVIVLILIVLIILYMQFRRNQRSNKIILQKSRQLEDMLAEKEWWLKEVHHRVKNNLHTIICLLESQAIYLEKDALQAIEKSQHRIYAMSLIHQKLYQNEDVRSIDMSLYLEEFIGYLKDSFDTSKIDFVVTVEPIHLDIQQAIPVGLIVNEGVTNSIKYAFDNTETPKICISMTEKSEMITLLVADNGKGFEMKAEDEEKSLGMQLIKGLGKELKGTAKINSKEGTKLIVEFKKGPVADTGFSTN